jgi:hypothetical protein
MEIECVSCSQKLEPFFARTVKNISAIFSKYSYTRMYKKRAWVLVNKNRFDYLTRPSIIKLFKLTDHLYKYANNDYERNRKRLTYLFVICPYYYEEIGNSFIEGFLCPECYSFAYLLNKIAPEAIQDAKNYRDWINNIPELLKGNSDLLKLFKWLMDNLKKDIKWAHYSEPYSKYKKLSGFSESGKGTLEMDFDNNRIEGQNSIYFRLDKYHNFRIPLPDSDVYGANDRKKGKSLGIWKVNTQNNIVNFKWGVFDTEYGCVSAHADSEIEYFWVWEIVVFES